MGQSSSRSPIEINVFEDRIPFPLKKKLKTKQFQNAEEMESCEKENCLYVRDGAGHCVWKISIEIEKQHKIIKWLSTDYYPWRMSVSSDGGLLIVNQPSSSLMIYGSNAELLRSIQIPTYIKYPGHVVETSIGNFIIINDDVEEDEKEEEDEEKEEKGDQEKGEEEEVDDETWVEEKEGEHGTMGENTPKVEKEKQKDEVRRKRERVEVKEIGRRKMKRGKKTSYLVRELTGDGQTVIRRFIPSNETQQLNTPQYFSIDSEDQVFVADHGNDRVILLDSDLKWKCILCPTKDEEKRKIRFPWRLCYDEEKKQLIVGGYNGANVYTLTQY